MKNLFLLYIPPSNHEALIHYEDTIKKKVESGRIFKYIDQNLRYQLQSIFGPKRIAVWGSRDSGANRSQYEKMQPGDDIFIVEGDTIKLLGKIAAKTFNQELSFELWKDIKGNTSEGWSLIYFIANSQEINLPFAKFLELFNYSPNYSLRGFSTVAEDKLEEFYSSYDDLYSILMKIKNGEIIEEKKEKEVVEDVIHEEVEEYKEIAEEEIEEILKDIHYSFLILQSWR